MTDPESINFSTFYATGFEGKRSTQLVSQLLPLFGSLQAWEQQLPKILTQIRSNCRASEGANSLLSTSDYGTGNLINLCHYLQIDLSDYDFSALTIRQADFQEMPLHNVNLHEPD